MTDRTPSPRRETCEETPVRKPKAKQPSTPGGVPLGETGCNEETPLKLLRRKRQDTSTELAEVCDDAAPAAPPGLAMSSPTKFKTGRPLRSTSKSKAKWVATGSPPMQEGQVSASTLTASRGAKCHTRSNRIVQLVQETLSNDEVKSWMDRDGFVPMSKLLRARPELQRETFGSTRVILSALEAPRGAQAPAAPTVRLDKSRRRVRLHSPGEMIRAEALALTLAAAEGRVPVEDLCRAAVLRPFLPMQKEDAQDLVREALEHEESEVEVRGLWIQRCPRPAQLRRAAEELFSDAHLEEDSRLRLRLLDSPDGEVPLAWLCGRYAERLGTPLSTEARAVEVSAKELGEALQASSTLRVDVRRSTVRRLVPFRAKSSLPSLETASASASQEGEGGDRLKGESDLQCVATKRAAVQLKQLLDFYFEPFTLQNNRYLLDLLMRTVGPPPEPGPWVAESLADFSCVMGDLMGLGRIASVLTKIKRPELLACLRESGPLKHLTVGTDGRLHLRSAVEVRNFVAAPGVQQTAVEAVIKSLTAAREQHSQAPPNSVSVISYTVDAALSDTQQSQQRQARLKRQLLVHKTDLVCLQGLDPDGTGAGLAATLSQDGYSFAQSRSFRGEVNAIFWDRSRWERLHTHHFDCNSCAAVLVDLRSFGPSNATLRVACIRPRPGRRQTETPTNRRANDLAALLAPRTPGAGLLVCADLWRVGGAEAAATVTELAHLPSASREVLGEEVLAPTEASSEQWTGDLPGPARSPVSGLNRLRRPDAILYDGMAPVAVLSGHTEGYLATMSNEDVLQQFPAFRTPLVAAFDLGVSSAHSSSGASARREVNAGPSAEDSTAGNKCFRL